MSVERSNLSKILRSLVKKDIFSLIVAIFFLVVVLSILSPYFFTIKNFLTVGLYASIIGIMAFGLTIAMLMGIFDLSQYAVATLSGIVMVYMMVAGIPIVWCILAAIITGLVCGAVNATIIIIFRVTPIIATMGTMMIFRGVAYIITKIQDTSFTNPVLDFIGRGYLIGIPVSLVIAVLIGLSTAFILKYTTYGRSIYAVGANSSASYISGININKVRALGILISSVFASFAGIVMTCQMGAVLASAGIGSELDIAAAVFLGGISLTGGKGTITGTILGLLILVLIGNGLTLLSVQAYYQMLIKGFVLIFAISIDSMRGGGYK
jgi:ribose/xylose/arabinose/galactoside ABC-type transport system permease subunit